MGHYFSFLKDCGKHLDPKTRDLISVITKVHAQTERGFRQYLGRALRDGCTPAEVLDALLMAFPALGLAKIVWAVDIILAMDMPGVQARGDAEPRPVARRDGRRRRSKAGEVQRVDCDGRGLFVYRDSQGHPCLRQPLPAPEHRHPAPGAARHDPDLPEAPMGSSTSSSGECIEKGNSPLAAMGKQGRRRAA